MTSGSRDLFVQPDPHIEGVVHISTDASLPRPRMLVLGSVHGDEPCGLHAIERLGREAREGALPLRRGTVTTVHGNPAASAQQRRYTEGGVDLNRQLDWRFAEELPEQDWVPEHRRAWELRPLLEDADALLDLHSASAPTRPFVITNGIGASSELAVRLGVRHVTNGWASGKALGARTTIGLLATRDRPGLGVECGQHGDREAPEVAYRCAMHFLSASRLLDREVPEAGDVVELEVFTMITKPSEGFRFASPIHGLQWIEEGAVIGSDGVHEIRMERGCYALLPNDEVPAGADMLYLARERS